MTEGLDVIFSFTYLVFGILPMFILFALFVYSNNKRKETEEKNKKEILLSSTGETALRVDMGDIDKKFEAEF